MADVFISYSREDRARAEQVARGLNQLGLDAFWDTDIPPGQTWADYIEAKLGSCKAVVVLWSEHSTKSQWVREEARMGRDKSKLIPARLDASTPPFGFGEVQAADLSTWNGDPQHPEWQRFSRAVFGATRGGEAPIPETKVTGWQTPPRQPHQQFAQQSNWQSGQAGIVSPSPQSQSPVALVQRALRMYVNGGGRSRQSELVWFSVFYMIVYMAAAFADAQQGINPVTGQLNSYLFQVGVWLIFICPFISLMSRRLHDTGQNGWIAALAAIPLIGWVLALVYMFIAGQPGDNRYGADPRTSVV